MGDIVVILISIFVYMTAIFIIAWRLKRIDVVDIAWGGAFIVIALTSFLLGEKGWLQLVVTGLVVIWGARLSYHIFRRFIRSKIEDYRYTEKRKEWKHHPALNAYLRIFIVQGALAFVISAAVIFINLSDVTVFTVPASIGVAMWLVGFMFEAVGDEQLRRHLTNPKNEGKLMTSGLWRYTRHPNYFGEALQWWGIAVVALVVPFGWLGLISPLVITYLLRFVTGVPLTEKHFEGRPGWSEYKERTNTFIPFLPRKE